MHRFESIHRELVQAIDASDVEELKKAVARMQIGMNMLGTGFGISMNLTYSKSYKF